MKTFKKLTTLITLTFIFTFFAQIGFGQVQIHVVDFESTGSGGYTTSVAEFSDGGTDYFTSTFNNSVGTAVSVSNIHGTNFFGAQDTDGEPGGGDFLDLYVNNVNITGYTNLELRVYLAEDDDGVNQDWDADSYLHISYEIDGGGSNNLLWVEAAGGTNTEPRIDSDFDGIGEGTAITSTFVQYISSITGTGADLDITFAIGMLDAGDEDIAIDHIEIWGTAAGGPEVDWCNLQWPATGNIRSGDAFNAYARVYESGVTDGAGQGANITAWIGYSLTDNDPSTASWTWVAATYNGDNGNNDEYIAEIGSTLSAGTYYYASRFQLSGGPYKYGGYNSGGGGFWDGATNVSNVLTVDVVDWCNIQSPENGTVAIGAGFNVYAQIYEDTETNPAGQAANITSWIGYSTVDNDPTDGANDADWTWVPASYNTDSGNNDEYSLDLENAIGAGGTYYYVSRFQISSGPYAYGGFNTASNDGPWTNTYSSGTGNKSGRLIITAPTITTSVASLTGFTYIEGSGPSVEQSYTVEGSNLTDDITVTPPANWEISLVSGGLYQTTPITLTQGGGTVATTTIYTIMSAGLTNAGSPYSGNIVNASTGATTQNVAVDGTVTVPVVPCTELLISEYCEGSSNNKYIEVYNGTGATIDFSATTYTLNKSPNGGGWSGSPYTLTGTLAHGGTFVLANTSANATILTAADDTENSVTVFNGNDAIGLFKTGTIIDVVGVETESSNWDVAGTTGATANHTIVRKNTVDYPNTDWVSSAGTTIANSEWTVYSQDEFTYIGSHTSNCDGPSITITGTDPTSDDFVQNSSDNILYQIEVAVAGGTDQEVSQIQFDALSTLANLDALVSGYTLYYSTDATLDGGDSNLGTVASTATTNQANILFNFSAVPVTITSGNTGYFFITTNVLLTANVGSTVQATNVDATYTTAGGATDSESYAAGNTHTIVLLQNTESDIITAGNEAVSVSSLENDVAITTTADGTEVWQFTIRDGGADGTDADNLATIVTGITISQDAGNQLQDWDDIIEACALFNGATKLADAVIPPAGNEIQFSGAPLISVPDEGSITLSLRLSVQSSPNDEGNNDDGDDFVFQISQGNVSTDAAGSGFDTFTATTSVNGSNLFDVTATHLQFVQQPTDVGVNTAMLPSPTVEATDIHGTRDLDFTDDIDITSIGTMTGDPIAVAAVAGLATFAGITHTVVQANVTLSASSGVLSVTGPSSTFDVLNITSLQSGDVAILSVNTNIDDGKDEIAFVCFEDILPGTKIYLTDNGYEREFANEWGGTEGLISITRTNSTLTQGTIIVIQGTHASGNITDPSHYDVYTNGAIDANWTKTALSGGSIGGFNLNSDDDVWILQGGTWTNSTSHHSTYDGNVLYGWTESGWDIGIGPGADGNKWSNLYPSSKCFTIVAPVGAGKVKFNDPVDPDFSTATNSKLDWIALMNETTNWDTYADNATYNSGGYDYIGNSSAPQLTIAANTYADGVWKGTQGTDWFDCGNWQTLTVPDASTNVTIDAAAANDILVDDASSEAALYGNLAECNNLSLDNLVDIQINTGDQIDIHGNLNISNASFTMTANSILNLYGNFTNNETTTEFVESTSFVNMLGTTSQTITTAGHTEEFNNLLINNSSPTGVILDNSIDINGELTHTNGLIDLNGNNIIVSGIYSRTNGEFKGNSASNFTIDGAGTIADLHFVAPQAINDFVLNRAEALNLQTTLEIHNELNIVTGAEVADNGNTITVREVVDIDGTHSGTGTILLSNTASNLYALQGTGSFGNLEMNSAGDDALIGNTINVNNFTLTAANSFDTDTYDMNVTGNWTNNVLNSTFLEATNTVTFNGTSNQIITAPNGQEFYDLVIDNATETDASLLLIQNDLTINAGDVFTINPDKYVTVIGTLTNTPGTSGLVLKSDASGTASLIHNTASIPATVERHLTGNNWHYLFAPLDNQDIDIFTTTSIGEDNPNFYFYDESIADFWDGSIVYNPTGWTAPAHTGKMLTDRGYIHHYIGDYVYSQTGGNLEVTDKSFNLSYIVNGTGNETTTGYDWTTFDGWNLVGNPYVSAVDWDNVGLDKTHIENFVYYYNDATDQYMCYGGAPPYNTGITINGGSNIIPAGQSVFVKVINDTHHNTNFDIPKAARVHNSQAFYKNNKDVVADLLRFRIEKGDYTDESVLRTDENATDEHDYSYDAYKMFSLNSIVPQIYTKTIDNSRLFSVNSLPVITGQKIVPVGCRINETGDYTIRFTENNFDDMHVWFEDVLLSETVNILNEDSYSFSQSTENNEDRFFIHIGINNKPIVNIQIPDQETEVNEFWSYDLPSNVFIDNDFEDEITVTASLASGDELPAWLTYDAELMQFFGTPADIQTIEIKLTATDVFGEEISDIFNLNVKNSTSVSDIIRNNILIYPNPTTGKLYIEISNSNIKGNIKMTNINGKELVKEIINSKKTEINISSLSSGIYFLEINTPTNTINEKIILK